MIGRLAVALLCLALLLPAGAAAQRPSQKKAIWGPVAMNGKSMFPTYRDLGVGILQMSVQWNVAAPTRPAHATDPADPAYKWPADVDRAVREGQRYGVRVLVQLAATPAWANDGRDPRWRPNRTRDFNAFAVAAARHWPGVHLWMIWGEPDNPSNFQPTGRTAARTYAKLLDGAYGALKRVDRRNLVIGGNTWTIGVPVVQTWLRSMRLPDGRPPRMDLYGHNPYTTRRPVLGQPPLGRGTADFGDLDVLTRWIDRYLGRGRDGRPLRIFISEISFPTGHENTIFGFHVTEAVQASWLTDALRATRRSSRIYSLGYFTLADMPLNGKGTQAETGLLRRDGSRKPAYYAFRRG